MNKKDAKDIIERYKSGSCNEDEKALVKNWILFGRFDELTFTDEEISKDLKEIDSRLPLVQPHKRIKLRPSYTIAVAAASIIVVISIWFYFPKNNIPSLPVSDSFVEHDIAPGKNRATLTLADGSVVELSDAKTGVVINVSGLKYSDGTTIASSLSEGATDGTFSELKEENQSSVGLEIKSGSDRAVQGRAQTLTMSTPRGGQYQVLLPDGTKVWLNAASSIKFPSSFASLKERRVEIKGEAYFEVAKDKMHPFKVVSGDQEISVLGTHFNVNSYNDNGSTKTTLVEGSVKVKKSTNTDEGMLLRPGQQSVLSEGHLEVSAADIDADLAWKNGLFRFNDEKLESIMQKLSRWYDVDVVFENEALKNEPFAGVTTRFANVSKLLRMLELTGEVRFKLTEGQITVLNAK